MGIISFQVKTNGDDVPVMGSNMGTQWEVQHVCPVTAVRFEVWRKNKRSAYFSKIPSLEEKLNRLLGNVV